MVEAKPHEGRLDGSADPLAYVSFLLLLLERDKSLPKRTETETGFRCRNQTKLPAVVAARGLGSVWTEWPNALGPANFQHVSLFGCVSR